MMNKTVLIMTMALSISGCSTVPISIPQEIGPRIVIARDTGFVGSGCDIAVRIDGKIVGILKAGSIVSTAVTPGKHKLSIGMGTYASTGGISAALCSNLTMSKVVGVENSPKQFRVGLGNIEQSQLFFDEVE